MPIRHPIAFWAQSGTTDFVAFVEQNDDGGRPLLRTCIGEREEEGDRELTCVIMREDGKCFAVGEQVFDQLMRAIAEGAGHPHDWEDTIGLVFGTVGVEMKTVIFKNEEAIKRMVKTAEESHHSRDFPFLRRECSQAFPVREDASKLVKAQPICSSAGGRSTLASCETTGASLDAPAEAEGFTGDVAAKEGGVFGEDHFFTLSELSKSDRSNMTKGELKWYASLWSLGRSSDILHAGLTEGEMKWFSRRWNFDLDEENEGGVVQEPEWKRQTILTVSASRTAHHVNR